MNKKNKILNKKNHSEYNVCDFCGKKSEDVVYQINPYKMDINGDYSKYYMCIDCVHESTLDI